MKYLIMCEGPNELEIIRMLLEHDKLIFTEDDLLNLVPCQTGIVCWKLFYINHIIFTYFYESGATIC